jgi:hypothetical protein
VARFTVKSVALQREVPRSLDLACHAPSWMMTNPIMSLKWDAKVLGGEVYFDIPEL